jgi:hypothetical protein
MTDDEIRAALKAAHACCSLREVAAVRTLLTALDAEHDTQIDERIRRYHDVACGYQRERDALQAQLDGATAPIVADPARR